MEELKIGAMISQANKKKLQAAHDALAELGVACQTVKSIGEDAFVFFGDNHTFWSCHIDSFLLKIKKERIISISFFS